MTEPTRNYSWVTCDISHINSVAHLKIKNGKICMTGCFELQYTSVNIGKPTVQECVFNCISFILLNYLFRLFFFFIVFFALVLTGSQIVKSINHILLSCLMVLIWSYKVIIWISDTTLSLAGPLYGSPRVYIALTCFFPFSIWFSYHFYPFFFLSAICQLLPMFSVSSATFF